MGTDPRMSVVDAGPRTHDRPKTCSSLAQMFPSMSANTPTLTVGSAERRPRGVFGQGTRRQSFDLSGKLDDPAVSFLGAESELATEGVESKRRDRSAARWTDNSFGSVDDADKGD